MDKVKERSTNFLNLLFDNPHEKEINSGRWLTTLKFEKIANRVIGIIMGTKKSNSDAK